MARHLLATFLCLSALVPSSRAQSAGVIPVYLMMNGGAGGADAAFQAVEFAQQKLQQDNRKAAEAEAERAKLVGAGSVSALDLQAPPKALDEYNKAMPMLKQNPKEAIAHLQKAIALYPKFVTAHNALGIAYLESRRQQTPGRASGVYAASQVAYAPRIADRHLGLCGAAFRV